VDAERGRCFSMNMMGRSCEWNMHDIMVKLNKLYGLDVIIESLREGDLVGCQKKKTVRSFIC
jgi:hypothetical protein